MLEKEILSEMTKAEFDKKLQEFTDKFGKPKTVKRIAFQATDFNQNNIDTRIRISNGKSILIQKKGDWKADTREEIEVELNPNTDAILKNYKILLNLINSNNIETSIIQVENYLFFDVETEIKLTHQFGKKDSYSFEVEVFNHELDLNKICEEFGLKVIERDNSPEYWKNWSKSINHQASDLNDSDLLELIKKYLD